MVLLMFLCGTMLWAGGGGQQSSSAASSISDSDKIFPQPRTIRVLWTEHPSYPFDRNSISIQTIFERTNARLDAELIPQAGAGERRNILIATNDLPELSFFPPGGLISNHYQDGIYLELSQYMNLMPNFRQFWDTMPQLRRSGNDDKLYCFHVLAPREPWPLPGPVIRTDLLERHNLPVPSTFTQLIDVLEALKRIYPDSRPWTNRNGTNQLFSAQAAYSMGSGWGMYWEDNVNRWLFGQATPEFKLALEVFADAYRRGVLDPDYATNNQDSWRNKSVSGQSFFFYDNSQFAIDFTRMMQINDPSMKMELIPTLTNARGQRRTRQFSPSYEYDLGSYTLAIRSDIRDPERIMRLVDWLYSEEGFIASNFGIEGLSFRFDSDGEPQYIPEWVSSIRRSPNVYTDVATIGGFGKQNSFGLITGENMLMISSQKASGQWDEVNENWWGLIDRESSEGVYTRHGFPPIFTAEEQNTIRNLSTRVNTFLNQEYHKYITGIEPISNWDAVVRQARELGAQQLEDIYNRAEARSN